ncbi:BtrH N-terminal domain-containing protein [Micromonospora sp. DT229]|uniref:BtrH N-terminal domain-containing protein n=1 Tax=Micromonospora sp. DT229 TaxID=3393430 RepID=UPI003CF83B9C
MAAATGWYRDPVSCLHTTLAALAAHAGEDPLAVVGLAWRFTYLPGDVRPEEYYWPCRSPDLAAEVLPHHEVRSRWRVADPGDPLADLEATLAAGRLPIVAVDNFHLPFRPAYHDVHAAHLIVVHSVDREQATVRVSDVMPPAYAGPLPVADLLRSWCAGAPADEQDVFFAGGPAENDARWLDVELDTPFPALDRARLAQACRANLADFHARDRHTGLTGLRLYLEDLVERAAGGDGEALTEAYTFGWAPQAQAALHGELLRTLGARWDDPGLAEAGRRVEQVAHRWTPLRVTAAHSHAEPRRHATELARHAHELRTAYARAVAAVGESV